MEEPLERAPVGVVEVSTEGCVRSLNSAAATLLSVDPDANAGEPIDDVVPPSVDDTVPGAFESPPDTEQSIEEYYPGLDRWISVTIVPGAEDVYLYLEETTEAHRSRRRRDSLDDEVSRLTVTNECIADILGALVDASTRTEIATTICEHLGTTELYDFAWVGEREPGSGDVVVSAAAGTTDRTIEAIEAALEEGASVPERRAIESGAVEVVQSLGDDDSVPESIRRAAFADGLQSLLAIPLRYGSSVYGVVGLYTSERGAFTERERSSFRTVGEMAGFAVNATRHRSLLRSSTVVELTFALEASDTPLSAAAVETGAALTVEGVVERDDQLLCYVSVEGEPPDALAAVLDAREEVDATRIVSDGSDAGSIELTVGGDTPMGLVASQGVTLQSAVFREGHHRIVVVLPPDEDVRRIATAFTRRFDADVVAKRERERERRSDVEFESDLAERLTDHQTDALRTALLADYFESPRGSTAEEVASALGITGPTLLHHLRAGQRKLLGEFFEVDRE
ncbi:bacterio-opsin activator domain-containing protein [Salinarchaeum laminariae]|uniref:bacterio-opsin activator domain-containing protein n=1 Tax=Salinarchaeum laminariae TaxID=869888 RepID=UPI0020BFC4D1|nr:bacterio-opsin activator domain-containing protein [Salinarchaeum laminariae]